MELNELCESIYDELKLKMPQDWNTVKVVFSVDGPASCTRLLLNESSEWVACGIAIDLPNMLALKKFWKDQSRSKENYWNTMELIFSMDGHCKTSFFEESVVFDD